MRYFSDVPLRVGAGELRATMPPYLADDSMFASAGTIDWDGGPLTIRASPAPRSRLGTTRLVRLGTPVATRVDEPGRVVPLARACGRYVDWYRLASD